MSPFKSWLAVLLVATHAICSLSLTPLTTAQVNKIVPDITKLISDSYVNTAKFEHPILGTIVRLAFHDCAGRNGCDGCLDTTLAANAGLDDVIAFLEEVYNPPNQPAKSLKSVLSRADFWALAGTVAVNMGIKNLQTSPPAPNSLLPTNFKWGRVDCGDSPLSKTDDASDFPSALLGPNGVKNYFFQRFKFNESQTVAIMGAHNLGQAHDEYSGFNESWTATGKRLGSEYYANIANGQLNWVQRQVSNGNYRWVPSASVAARGPAPRPGSATPAIMMLNADMALYKNLKISNSANGQVSCQYGNCGSTDKLFNVVSRFASNTGDFLGAFANAFTAMLAVCGRPVIGGALTACPNKRLQ